MGYRFAFLFERVCVGRVRVRVRVRVARVVLVRVRPPLFIGFDPYPFGISSPRVSLARLRPSLADQA